MFERYTEKARRVIFFSRYEASQLGSPEIDTEHLLLGLLREDKSLANRMLASSKLSPEAVRAEIVRRAPAAAKFPTSVDLPLSHAGKRALVYAAEESQHSGHHFIGPEHLLLGLLRETKGVAAEVLAPARIDIKSIREHVVDPNAPSAEAVRPLPTMRRYYGKYRGTVVGNQDPEQLGRIQVEVADVSGLEENWALPSVPYPADLMSPMLAVPPIGASVWVEFEAGDPNYAVWSGCFWAAGQPPLLKLP